jgi:hypothetical protein
MFVVTGMIIPAKVMPPRGPLSQWLELGKMLVVVALAPELG